MDPQGFEVKFQTLAKLAKRQIDLLYLFPSGRRNALRARVQVRCEQKVEPVK
jgi:hypothetical protein